LKKIDHNIGFREKRQFFRRKLGKIAENCDHKIDPRYGFLLYVCQWQHDRLAKKKKF
jgi:hypothetical protein